MQYTKTMLDVKRAIYDEATDNWVVTQFLKLLEIEYPEKWIHLMGIRFDAYRLERYLKNTSPMPCDFDCGAYKRTLNYNVGDTYYDMDENTLLMYNGETWQDIRA